METVDVKQIDQVIKSFAIRQVMLLHMDCQGCEYETLEYILEGAHRTKEIQVSFSTAVPDAHGRYCHIQDELKATHKLVYRYPYVFESWVRK